MNAGTTGATTPPQSHRSTLHTFADALRRQIAGEADFSAAAVAMYTSDASNYRQVPLGVVYPRHAGDVTDITRLCREYKLPVLMRGAGTSQNGQCVNNAIVLDCSRFMNRVLSIDPQNRLALVEPGVVCDALKAAAEPHGLTFGPDPATHSRCTLGGMIGNNSCGPHSMLAGKTVENLLRMEILTASGERFWVGPTSDTELQAIIAANDERARIYSALKQIRDEHADEIRKRYPTIKRRVSGYNLDQLLPENGFNVARALVGSEGTCVSILQAEMSLIELPRHTQLLVLGFETIFLAGDAVRDILPFSPVAMEGLDWNIVGGLVERELRLDEVAMLPDGRAWLLVELAGNDMHTLQDRAREFCDSMQANALVKSIKAVNDPGDVTAMWAIREQGASATALSLDASEPDPAVGWEDTAVDPLQLGDYLRELYALVDRFNYKTSLYGHFGDGCIHARMTFDTRSKDGIAKWREFSEAIARLVVQYGGSLSGEHGDGQAKAEFLPIMFGERVMQAFRDFKNAWDPLNRMNPGKLINAARMHENLRYGPDYATPAVQTVLQFSEDPAGFGRTTERCIGMGKCRASSGAMCPSYQATGQERYSTRGRAHLLHELVRGELIEDGWQDDNIADSLEHCLSCKACKSECPTGVDIAAYKSEFLYKHFKFKRRPLHQQLTGKAGSLIPFMGRFPRISNAVQSSWPLRWLNHLIGFRHDRPMPAFAKQSFTRWAKQYADAQDEHFSWFASASANARTVILWVDTVNNHYQPDILRSAVTVLCANGYRVGVATEHFCCGRPLYDVGFLDQARTRLDAVRNVFHTSLPAEARVVVLEPSCLSVFRDELLRLYPNDPAALDLHDRCISLARLLCDQPLALTTRLPRAILHLHCHDKSVGDAGFERALMNQCIQSVEEPEAGCCGMAGTFGMARQTGDIADTLFNRSLQPAIKQQQMQTVLVSNGFSCRSQMAVSSHTTVLHPIEVIERCL